MKTLIFLAIHFAGMLFASETSLREPIVLVHGLLGFSGQLPMQKSYWGDIPEFLQEQKAIVLVADLSALHDSPTRGEQLAEQLKAFGYERYHLVGHSQGGIDARYVLEHYPAMVASLTTISTPHRGSPVADAIYDAIESLPFASPWIWNAGNLIGCTLDGLSRHFCAFACALKELSPKMVAYHIFTMSAQQLTLPLALRPALTKAAASAQTIVCDLKQQLCLALGHHDAKSAFRTLTSESMDEFNTTHRRGIEDLNDAQLYSWGSCEVKANGYLDLPSLAMKISGWLFFGDEKNDGLVSIQSMKFGHWLGECSGAHHAIAGHNGLGMFCDEHILWLRHMFRELLNKISTSEEYRASIGSDREHHLLP